VNTSPGGVVGVGMAVGVGVAQAPAVQTSPASQQTLPHKPAFVVSLPAGPQVKHAPLGRLGWRRLQRASRRHAFRSANAVL